LPSDAEFQPAGDGVRSVVRLDSYQAFTECRVRRDSLISHGQSDNAMDTVRFLVERRSHADELWRRRDRQYDVTSIEARIMDLRQQIQTTGWASTTMQLAPAVRLRPIILPRKIAGFLDFVQGVYELGGWRGSIRFDLQLVSPDAFPAVSAPKQPGSRASEMIDFLHLSETITLRTTAEFQYESLETRRDEIVEETMRRIAHYFGMDEFLV
jgi:hypothetical protein